MQTPAVRFSLLAVLLLSGLGAGCVTWDLHRRAAHVLDNGRENEARLDRLISAVTALGAAQQAYVAPGQSRAEWVSRASLLLQQLYDESAALRPGARSTTAAPALRAFAESVDGVVKIDTRVREHLRDGQELMAADLLFSEGRQAIDTMTGQLVELGASERMAADGERQALVGGATTVIAVTALLWIAGALALARVPRSEIAAPTFPLESAVPPSSSMTEPASPAAPIDLAEAADVCTALSRLTSGSTLPALLGRAATVLDASGLIVWLGAGEELFPVAAHGYDPRVIGRLGPIRRQAENATAAAWRTAEIRTVTGDIMANGAIVAPLFGPGDCVGVLAAEVRHGREADAATRAVTAMFAAQLAAIVSAWPAPSVVEGPAETGPTAASA